MSRRSWGLVVAGAAGLVALAVGHRMQADQQRAALLAALEAEWAGRGRAESWRTAPAWGGQLPTVEDAATPWEGTRSVLGMVLISALRDDPRGLPRERWSTLLDVVEQERSDDPLLAVARRAVALRTGVALSPEPEPRSPWEAWLALEQARTAGDLPLDEPAQLLLEAWPRHAHACLVGVRWGLARGRLAAAERLGAACRWSGPALGRLRGDVLDALGEPDAAWSAWTDAGAVVHAGAVACQEGLDRPRRAWTSAAPPERLHGAWCALAEGDEAAHTRERGRLGAVVDDQPPLRLARAALALAVAEPALAIELLGDLDSARALVIQGRAHAALGDQARARQAFQAAQAQLPFERAVVAAWGASLPEDLPLLAEQWTGPSLLLLAQGDLVGDRDRPWALVAGLSASEECSLCAWLPGFPAALAGPPARCGGDGGSSPWCGSDGQGTDGAALREAVRLQHRDPDAARAALAELVDRHPTLPGLARLLAQWERP